MVLGGRQRRLDLTRWLLMSVPNSNPDRNTGSSGASRSDNIDEGPSCDPGSYRLNNMVHGYHV
jgi:hypothetical protein